MINNKHFTFKEVIDYLKQVSFQANLNFDAHYEIAPYRKNTILETTNDKTKIAIPSAVLLLIYPFENQAHFTLIKRSTYEGNHSNQIALPGGKKENSDYNLIETAIREAQEEININAKDINYLFNLSNVYIPNSNFKVTPILAYSLSTPNFIANEREVAEILEPPISILLSDEIIQKTKIKFSSGISFETPYLNINNEIVWGATGMIINEFRKIILANFK